MRKITLTFLIFTFLFSGMLAAQTLQEKIGQMIMVGLYPYNDSGITIEKELKNGRVGGILIFGYEIDSPSQIKSLNAQLSSEASAPLFLATDQEGGLVARLNENNGYQQTYTAYQLGTEFNSEDSTRKQAALMAGWMKQAGFNMNLAPVVDVNINPDSPAIGRKDRSFSSDAYSVYLHASWFMDEFHQQNIATSIKHFPGHGSAVDDTHKDFTDITQTWEERELDPFKFIIQNEYQDAVMTGHLFKQDWDSTYPASLSKYAVTDMLRDSLGFEGVVISDELFMGAIQNNFGMEETVIQAVNSGTDILLFNKYIYNNQSLPQYIISLVTQKIQEGVIAESTIDAAYQRIMALKQARIPTGIEEAPFDDSKPNAISISNYPNPFNPATTVSISLDYSTEMQLQVFNSVGQVIHTFTQSKLAAGVHTFRFDGSNLASGMYLALLTTPKIRQVHKMMLIK